LEFYETVSIRRSVRKFSDRKIAPEILERVLDAGRLSPSAVNLQPWKFMVIRSPETRRALVECTRGGKQAHLAMGDLCIVACGHEEDCYQRQGNYMKSFAIDVAIALDHMMLAAAAEGLGLQIPNPWRVVGMTPLGYPAESPPFRGRKGMKEIVCYEKWDE
jgi:nitroreductase